jgi:cell division protein YceG involved in septum cleavage
MNRTGYTVKTGSSYYRLNRKKIWAAGTAILVLLVLFSVLFMTKTVTAESDTNKVKLVKSIEVKKGDTLWSIASDYYSDEYDDMNDYIHEIKECNGISGDSIHVGNYIVVPFYTEVNH